jgi:acyl carrier protein
MTESDVRDIIYGALRSLNTELAADRQIPISPETKLFGVGAALDSLSLVSVILDVEGGVESAFGRSVSLTDDRAMSQEISPFSDVSSLTAYIKLLVSEVA